jgi:polyhydroxybutyrate depolymerase
LGNCSPIHPTAVLLIPGTADSNPHSTYSGFQPYYMSVNEITTYWANHNNTDTNPIVTPISNTNNSDGSTVEMRIWKNGDNCVAVKELKVINGDHDWPGSFGNMDINATQEIWKFLSKYDINGLINCGLNSSIETNESEIQIFPNPTSQHLSINGINEKNLNYTIYNSKGELVINGVLNSNKFSVDISELESHIYILRIGNFSYKIIKE